MPISSADRSFWTRACNSYNNSQLQAAPESNASWPAPTAAMSGISNPSVQSTAYLNMRWRGERKGPKDFKLGAIIRTPHIVPRMDTKTADPYNKSVVNSQFGELCVKERYFVVFAKFSSHMLAFPIMSHGSRGIGYKSPEQRAEYIGIRKHEDDFYVNETNYEPVVVEWTNWPMMPESNLHIGAPTVIYYDFKIVTTGLIEDGSFERMIEAFSEQMQKMVLMSKGEGVEDPAATALQAQVPGFPAALSSAPPATSRAVAPPPGALLEKVAA